jgi:hypothetical protein
MVGATRRPVNESDGIAGIAKGLLAIAVGTAMCELKAVEMIV